MTDSQAPEVRDFGQVTFHIEGPLGIITLNRPEVLNAQGYELLAQVDQAFDLAQDAQGFRSVLEDSLGDYVAMMFMPGFSTILEDKKRLRAVDLAVRGQRGERYGQGATQRET
jgi:hypothetical protein